MLPSEQVLLDVLQAATELSGAQYRRFVLDWLKREIGFDGAVWGRGRRLADGTVHVAGGEVMGRPAGLLADFAEVAQADPVSRRFGAAPRRVQCVDVARHYASPGLQPVGQYLERYQVRHLLLCGAVNRRGDLSWITFFREDRGRPFEAAAKMLAGFAVPFVLLAGCANCMPEACNECPGLSRREREVAAAYAAGEGYKGVARNLGLSPATVRTHLLAIFRKLDVHNKIELRQRLEMG